MKEGIKLIHSLLALPLSEEDPKDNTGIQRSWLPYKDKALITAESNIVKN